METFPDIGPENVKSFSEEFINVVLTHPDSRQKNHPSGLPGNYNSNWVELKLDQQQPVDNYTDFVFDVFEELPADPTSRQIVIMGEFTQIKETNQAEEYDLLYFIHANGTVSATVIEVSDEDNDDESVFRIQHLDDGQIKSLVEILQKWLQINIRQQEGVVIELPITPEEI